MNRKDSFILYNNMFDMIEELSNEEAGELIKSVFQYSINGATPKFEKGSIKSVVFKSIKNSIDINTEKYIKRCEKNSENAQKRWNQEKNVEEDFRIVYVFDKKLNQKEFSKSYSKGFRSLYTSHLYNSFEEIYQEQQRFIKLKQFDKIRDIFNYNKDDLYDEEEF